MSVDDSRARTDSVIPDPSERHETVTGEDGTRLFLRTMPSRSAEARVRAIFCDGILCDGFIWKYLWNDVAGACDVAHWHYRGHGRSGAPADPTRIDIAAHATDLMSVRRHLGDPPCVVLGHSMGTQVCLEGWRLFPENVKGLVLLCGSFGKVTHSFRGVPILDKILPKLMDIVEKQPDIVRAIWSRIPPEMAFRAALLAGDVDQAHVRREDMLPYLKHMTHVDFPMFLKMLRSAGDHSAEEYLAKIDVPVLIIAGEKDTFTPASLSESMAEQIPGAELLMVPGGTHVAPIEQPDLIGERIRAFIDRVTAS
ncbi:MAG: alpha/beta hydrolase [Labilithrix sp.]|nr:alpha/beta hydrolase [Labilithrix sp.]